MNLGNFEDEGLNGGFDDEAALAKADLYKLGKYSIKLFKMLHDGQELDGWVQAKITKAADYIASVYHYMEYEMKSSEYGEQLDTADVYSESIQEVYQKKLMEARDRIKQKPAVCKESSKVCKENSKVCKEQSKICKEGSQQLVETVYDTIKSPKYGVLKWMNYGGAHMIATQEPGGPLKSYKIGSHEEIAHAWKKLKAKIQGSQQFESIIEMLSEKAKPSAGIPKSQKSVKKPVVKNTKAVVGRAQSKPQAKKAK